MKKCINKKIFSVVGMLLILLFTANSTVYAYQEKTQKTMQNYELKFTDSAKSNITLIQKLVKKAGIKVINGKYVIMDNSLAITKLDSKTKAKVTELVDMYNEGISYGLFEIDSNNNIISSQNYEINGFYKDNIIRPSIASANIDSFFKANAGNLYRVLYINVETYGNNIGTVETGKYFASKVRTGGDWDYKHQLGTTTLYSAYIDGGYENMTGEDIGNAHYGYVGRKIFGANLLRSAAGAYQIYSGTSYIGWYNSYFDDPNDQYWINRGISYSEGNGF